MPSERSADDLLNWCHTNHLDEIQISAVGVHKWKSGLARSLASIDPSEIDRLDSYGITALGRLASYRPPEELKLVIGQGVDMLLAAGANPLLGASPAILRGQVFSEDVVLNKMLAALVAAQHSGSPYRLPGNDGNLLHAMVSGNIGVFAHLAHDQFGALAGCRDVVAAWRDDVDTAGKTPVDLAWEQYPNNLNGEPYPTSSGNRSEAESAALWSLLLPGKQGIWQPPAMDMECADGSLLYQRVLMKIDQGMAVPRRAEGLVAQLRAMALGSCMDQDTPSPSDGRPVRTPRL